MGFEKSWLSVMDEEMVKRKLLSLLAIASSTSMIFLDSTILPVAIPTIQRDLNVSSLELQWMINAYPLAIASLALAGGRIADFFGHRRLFCIGLLLFALASALGGMAHAGWWLILGRIFQGVGGAFMGPAALSLMIDIFNEKERGRALGSVVAISSLFLSLGPFLGGFFTEYLTWRIVFWINLPIAFVGVSLALSVIPKSMKHQEEFDFFGGITLVVGLVSIILALMNGHAWGWASWKTLSLFALFLLSAILFPISERLSINPLFDWKLFKNRFFLGGNLLVMTTQVLLMMTVYWAIYFQNILDLSPMEAGGMTLIAMLPIIAFAPIGGWLHDRRGPHFPILMGFLLTMFGFVWFLILLNTKEPLFLTPGLFAFGAGIPLILTPTSTTTLSAVPEKKRGVASGIYNTMRYVGATLGIALLGSVINGSIHWKFAELMRSDPNTQSLDPTLYWGLKVKSAEIADALASLSPLEKGLIQEALEKANYFGYTIATCMALLFSLFGILISRNYLKQR